MVVIFIMLMVMLPILIPAVKRQFRKPEFDDAYMFDDFICNDFFTEDKFEIINAAEKQIQIGTDEYPGFLLKQKDDGFHFLISTKYITKINKAELQWCTQTQFNHYKVIGKIPLYVMIGIGASSHFPEKLFLIPLDNLSSNIALLSQIQLFEVSLGQKINFAD